MKIRNGFVSNSSSSSFIIIASVDAFDPCGSCGRQGPSFFKKAEKALRDTTFYNKRDAVKELEDRIQWTEDCDEVKALKRILQLMKKPPKGYRVAYLDVETCDTDAFDLLMDFYPDAKFLEEDYKLCLEAIEEAEKMKKGK